MPEHTHEVKMMQSPGKWPMWPYLPLKKPRSRGRYDLGVLVEIGGKVEPTVYLCNLIEGLRSDTPKIEYMSGPQSHAICEWSSGAIAQKLPSAR